MPQSVFKNGLCMYIFILVASCATVQKPQGVESGSIQIRSVLDEEVCNLIINDSVYFLNRKIVTDRSLGIDPKNWINLRSVKSQIRIKVTFEGDIMHANDRAEPAIRKIELDTLFDLAHGRYLIIEAEFDKITLGYSKKPIRLN